MSRAELRNNPVRLQLRPGEMFDLVIDVLDKDIPVEVPDKFAEPDGSMGLEELTSMWDHERRQLSNLLTGVTKKTLKDVMFSHPAAGPLDPTRTLKLAIAHFDTHRRQIDKIKSEILADSE